jgi:hypothetical protein
VLQSRLGRRPRTPASLRDPAGPPSSPTPSRRGPFPPRPCGPEQPPGWASRPAPPIGSRPASQPGWAGIPPPARPAFRPRLGRFLLRPRLGLPRFAPVGRFLGWPGTWFPGWASYSGRAGSPSRPSILPATPRWAGLSSAPDWAGSGGSGLAGIHLQAAIC